MKQKEAIKVFEDRKVRAIWDMEKEQWYFSIVDVIAVLTDQNDYQGARNYWKVLKFRLLKEGNETVTNCNQLKLLAEDGKMRLTDVADTELILNMLAEASTKDISQAVNPESFEESKKVAKQGGNVAKVARLELEARTGKKVVSPLNAKQAIAEKNKKEGKVE